MPAKQLRCEETLEDGYDPTGENAGECGAVALACADCGDSAGCTEHAQLCPHCGNAVCSHCAEEHGCHLGTDAVNRGLYPIRLSKPRGVGYLLGSAACGFLAFGMSAAL